MAGYYSSAIGNVIANVGNTGITASEVGNIIADNYITGCGTAGGAAAGIVPSAYSVVSGNTILDCGTYGILLTDKSYVTIVGNNCTDTGAVQDYGIYESGTADYNTIVGNNCTGNETADIVKSGANSKVIANVGYHDRKSGATATVADGGTVTHGLGYEPTWITVNPTVSGEFVSVTAKSSTTFTVAIKKHDNSAGTTQTLYWQCGV
jgi:parallel beta-helix repeat protein